MPFELADSFGKRTGKSSLNRLSEDGKYCVVSHIVLRLISDVLSKYFETLTHLGSGLLS